MLHESKLYDISSCLWVAENGACDGHTLLLPPRQLTALLPNFGVIAAQRESEIRVAERWMV